MKKIVALTVLGILCILPAQGYCFIDYLFGGSAMSDSIGNNVVGDLRAWWTGNPVYNFNPYYSGANQGLPAQNPNQAPNFQAMPQQSYAQPNQQPDVTYYPPQAQQQYAYPPQQAMQQQAPMPQQQVQQAPRQTRRPAPQPQARVQQPQQQQYYQAQPQQPYQQPQPQAYYQQPQPYYGQEQQPSPGNRFQTYQYEHEVPSE
jgi:hypothetical protein|uniref:Uncharacterized protein n=1 Tax=Desulfomonile tiedjei TaxID=2358 RepID=A0A7C4AQ10_9BACT